ncbi:cyanophycinase [Ornithinimicrobium faecis]|uniref:Cyanophycinase n=1 Tax=Ornithinimicrobium faecis TaxID=2934158 RepID=A0ABY4YN72_9MICO|nr:MULTISPECIES: cyanophycinase [unclassified Ornithinimicrobium]USQ78247.1 cyanophycinase [Ornithinimicrobium sp. HY1793]
MSSHVTPVSDPVEPSEEQVQRTLLVIGGAEDKRRRVVVLKRFVRLAGGRDARVVVIPTASSMAEEAFEVYQSVFGRQHVTDVSLVNPQDRQQASDPALIEAIDNATGVFVTGGNQLKLGQLIVGTPVHDAITRAYHRGAVISGTSAGASVLSQFMISMGEEGVVPRQRVSQVSAGMGLLPGVILDQHFGQRTRYARLLSLIAASPSLLGVGIDEDTAAEIVNERSMTVVGSGAVYVVDARAAVSDAHEARRDAPLMVSGAVVHSLPFGSTFDLQAAQLTDFVEMHSEVAVVTSPTDVHDTANAAAALRR